VSADVVVDVDFVLRRRRRKSITTVLTGPGAGVATSRE
jgi:hypothetical protein